jgi:hypothetical protein
MKLRETSKNLADKTKIKNFILSLAPEDLKIIYEGLCYAQLNYLMLLEDKNIIKNYLKISNHLNKISLTIQEFKKFIKN